MDITPAQLEVVSSLAQDDIPFKLRCATCNKLALNAFRLPCCEQSICESCQQTLPENCPVCDHSPLSSDLCKPNKALRTTIRVFLRTEEKKREKTQQPVQQTLVKDEGTAVSTPARQGDRDDQIVTESVDVTGAGNLVEVGNAVSEEVIKPKEIVNGETGVAGPPEDLNVQQSELIGVQEKEASQPQESPTAEQAEPNPQKAEGNTGVNGGPGQAEAAQNGMGFDLTNGFNGMGWNGQPDYSQVMQMMASGGMGANPMANFQNMMGMPGFGMDPMSQSMYGGFGNMGMNMNNGMNGINFNAGQGMYGGWNGQPNMWNGGQVNNNPNAFPNSMGNFGSNSGYGYNMSQHSGNFSQMPQQQQFPNHDYQQGYSRPYGRGRGRGRGYDNYGNRGRGGYGQQQQQQQQYNQGYQSNYQAQQNQPQQQWQQQNSARHQSTPNRSTSPAETVIITDTVVPPSTHTAQTEEEDQALQSIENLPQQDEDQSPQGDEQQSVKNEPDQIVSSPMKDAPAPEQVEEENTAEKPDVTSEENHFQPVRSVLDDDIAQNENPPLQTESMPHTEDPAQSATSIMAPPTAPAGPAAHFQGDTYDISVRGRGSARAPYRGGVRGRGSFSNGSVFTSPPRTSVSDFLISAAVQPKGLGVAGAPTGPKAMREGLTGAGRGTNIRGSATATSVPTGPRIPEQDRSESQERYRDRDKSRSRSRSRSRTRSPSRHHSRRHRYRRHRSASVSDTELEREKRRERKYRRSRRDDDHEQDVQEEYHQASRASTPESSRIPSRDEQEKDRRSSHKHRSSHRSHRHRSRSRERRGDKAPLTPLENGGEKNGDYAKEERQPERSSRRSEKERSKRHREDDHEEKSHDRKRSRRDRSPTPEDSEYSSHRESRRQKREPEPEIPKGPRQKTYEQKAYEKPAEPQKDPHTLEREARNLERLLKEQQRRDALSTGRDNKGPKRRESRQSDGGSRRMSYKYEDDDGHARAARIEEEREAARWN